jgi:hypothetical protein
MMGKMIFAMAACLMATTAFAQNSDSTDSSANAATLPAATTTIQQGVEGNAGGESTAGLSTEATGKPKFGLNLMQYTYFKKSSVTDGEPDASGINRVNLAYRLSDTRSFSAREDFGITWAQQKTGRETAGHVNDMYVAYTDSKLAVLPGEWTLTGSYRQYLPIGEKTRFVTKANGSEYLALLLDKSVGKFDFETALIGQYFNNTQDYVVSGDGKNKITGTDDYLVEPFAEVVYNISPKLALMHDMALVSKKMRGTPDANSDRAENDFYNETYIQYKPTKKVTLMASIENDADLQSNNAVSLYQDADVIYNVYLLLAL